MRTTDPFGYELAQMADECGLTSQQRKVVAGFYRRQISEVMLIAAELVADEDHGQQKANHP